MASSLQKSKILFFLLIIVPAIIIIFVALLALQGQQVRRLQLEKQAMEQNLSAVRLQAEFYKKAYDVTLHDVMTLSRIYGGQQKYGAQAERLRAQELSVFFARH